MADYGMFATRESGAGKSYDDSVEGKTPRVRELTRHSHAGHRHEIFFPPIVLNKNMTIFYFFFTLLNPSFFWFVTISRHVRMRIPSGFGEKHNLFFCDFHYRRLQKKKKY